MLQTQTIEPGTFSVLEKLMALPSLQDFCLVGGTALSLKYGHRISVDLDLFSNKEFNKEQILLELTQVFGKEFSYENSKAPWAIFCYLQNIKVDIIHYKHPQIADTEILDNLRLYSSLDLFAMKINAILGRGKKKDFWDIAELLQHYTLAQCIEAHSKKYPSQQLLISIPGALTYFTDADESEEPISLKGQTWASVKKIIQQKVSEYLK
jgi:predicted nucleotidyltransferase component of viral defense system